MSSKIKLAIPLVLVLSALIILFGNNKTDNSNSGAPAALSEVPGRTYSCETELVNAFNKNETLKISNQVQNTKLVWKDKKYETLVLDCPNEEESFNKVFLLKNDDGKIIFSMTDERFDKSEIKDINRDGQPELIVTHGSSGNCWNCQGLSIFKIVNGDIKDMFPDLPRIDGAKYSNLWLRDINNDKIEEILVTDDSWENHEGFFHYNAPQRVLVLSWEDGEYLDNGEAFSKYYLTKIAENNKAMKDLYNSKDTTLNSLVSLAVENFWNYQEMGKNDEAYANFILQTNLETLPKTIAINKSDKIWLLGIRNEIEKEYKEARPTIMPLY